MTSLIDILNRGSRVLHIPWSNRGKPPYRDPVTNRTGSEQQHPPALNSQEYEISDPIRTRNKKLKDASCSEKSYILQSFYTKAREHCYSKDDSDIALIVYDTIDKALVNAPEELRDPCTIEILTTLTMTDGIQYDAKNGNPFDFSRAQSALTIPLKDFFKRVGCERKDDPNMENTPIEQAFERLLDNKYVGVLLNNGRPTLVYTPKIDPYISLS